APARQRREELHVETGLLLAEVVLADRRRVLAAKLLREARRFEPSRERLLADLEACRRREVGVVGGERLEIDRIGELVEGVEAVGPATHEDEGVQVRLYGNDQSRERLAIRERRHQAHLSMS